MLFSRMKVILWGTCLVMQAAKGSSFAGFVKASKREKFASCAPDFSYASLCDCVSLAFIYRQPAPLETVLFNRKQGRQVSEVAKQQVARLDSDEQILGFRATNERLFALTSTKLFVLKVNNN